MSERDHEALGDILGVLDRALGFPITDLQSLEDTELSAGCPDSLSGGARRSNQAPEPELPRPPS
jgi:hypothetical protein